MGHEDLLNFCYAHKKIFCYGAGNYAMVVREFLYEHNINPDKFVVTDINGQKSYLMGLPVEQISEAKDIDDSVGIIIAVKENQHDEIIKTLRNYCDNEYFQITVDCFNDINRHTAFDNVWNDSNGKVCVLLYHRVCRLQLNVWGLAISPENFEQHIKYYKQNYDIVRFEEDWTGIDRPALAITFDDGYADNFKYALPILEKYQVPATIFVSTGNIGNDREFWWDELERVVFFSSKTEYYFYPCNEILRIGNYPEKENACRKIRLYLKELLPEQRELFLAEMGRELGVDGCPREFNRSLTEDELVKMAESPYITIGGHTVTHNMLSAEPVYMQEWEITESKNRIERIIDREIEVFSYPFGADKDLNESSIECVEKAGYRKAATTSVGLAGVETHPLLIPRNVIPHYQECSEVKRQLKKIYTLF